MYLRKEGLDWHQARDGFCMSSDSDDVTRTSFPPLIRDHLSVSTIFKQALSHVAKMVTSS